MEVIESWRTVLVDKIEKNIRERQFNERVEKVYPQLVNALYDKIEELMHPIFTALETYQDSDVLPVFKLERDEENLVFLITAMGNYLKIHPAGSEQSHDPIWTLYWEYKQENKNASYERTFIEFDSEWYWAIMSTKTHDVERLKDNHILELLNRAFLEQ